MSTPVSGGLVGMVGWDKRNGRVGRILQEDPLSPSGAFRATLGASVAALIDDLPHDGAVLLTLYAIDDHDDAEQADMAGSVFRDAIAAKIIELVNEPAGSHDLFRMGPYRNG